MFHKSVSDDLRDPKRSVYALNFAKFVTVGIHKIGMINFGSRRIIVSLPTEYNAMARSFFASMKIVEIDRKQLISCSVWN